MSLTLGRAEVDDPDRFVFDGPRVTVEGAVLPDESTDAEKVAGYLAVRQQLVGMVENPDMDVWPVWSSEDPSIDGWYRVRRAEVTPEPVALSSGPARYRVELERGSGLVSPLVESMVSSVLLTNSHAVAASGTVASAWVVPGSAMAVNPPTLVAGQPAAGARVSEDGALSFWRIDDAVDSASWQIDPSDCWESAARVEAKLTASTTEWRPMVGRSAPLTADRWRIGNGLVQVVPSSTSGKLLDVSFWDSSWSTVQSLEYKVRSPHTAPYDVQATVEDVVSVVIVRNQPEVCTLRVTAKVPSVTGTSADVKAQVLSAFFTLDLTVRRGEPLVRVAVTHPRNLSATIGVGAASGTATTLTGGVRSDSTVNGGRLLLATPTAFTATTGTGNPELATTGTVSSLLFGIGYEIDGSSASTYNTAQQIIYQYLMPVAEKARVVLR